jgi:hypothetical protein
MQLLHPMEIQSKYVRQHLISDAQQLNLQQELRALYVTLQDFG